jgi:hypothetical protein
MARGGSGWQSHSSPESAAMNCSDQFLHFYILPLLASLGRDCCRFVRLLLLSAASGAGAAAMSAAAAAACCLLLRANHVGQHMWGICTAAETSHTRNCGQFLCNRSLGAAIEATLRLLYSSCLAGYHFEGCKKLFTHMQGQSERLKRPTEVLLLG